MGSSVIVNDSRVRCGIKVTPISRPALRQAIERLRHGGVVAIACDAPGDCGEMLLSFFGHGARLPVGHTRLALDTGAQMVVGVSHCVGDGQYRARLPWPPGPLAPRPLDVRKELDGCPQNACGFGVHGHHPNSGQDRGQTRELAEALISGAEVSVGF